MAKTLENGKHEILECSMCRKQLLEIWITKPKLEKITKVQATCPYCKPEANGKLQTSFVLGVSGGFHYGPIFKDKGVGTEDDNQITFIQDIVDGNDKTIFIVGKR